MFPTDAQKFKGQG